MTPYNTGRVRIGSGYTPPVRGVIGQHELQLQRALIEPGTARMSRCDKAITWFCTLVLIAVCTAAALEWI